MTRLRLDIDLPRSLLWQKTEARQTLISAGGNSLLELNLQTKPTTGGLWSGKARIKIARDSPAWRTLVEDGVSGVAWVYWERDESVAANHEKDTDLLWLGVADGASSEGGDSEVVTVSLKGAGEFLKDSTYTGTHTNATIASIATAIYLQLTNSTLSPVDFYDVETTGVMAKKITTDWDNAPVDRCLKELAAYAGGSGQAIWGIEPSTSANVFGRAYFRLWRGHAWEKLTATDGRSFSLDKSEATKLDVRANSKGIINSVTVIGKERSYSTADAKAFYEATSKNTESANRHGLRRSIIVDSALDSEGLCALKAEAVVRSRANRGISARAAAQVELENNTTVTGKAENIVSSQIMRPGAVTSVRDGNPGLVWGDSKRVYCATRNTAGGQAGSFLHIDVSNAPAVEGLNGTAPILDINGGLVDGEKRLYVCRMKRPTVVAGAQTQGLNCFELDRRHGLLWVNTGGATGSASTWRLGIGRHNGTEWLPMLPLDGATATTAQISSEHIIALELSYYSATQYRAKSWFSYDPDPVVLGVMMEDNIENYVTVNSGGGDAIFLNALLTNGTDPALKGDCFSADYGGFEIYRTWQKSDDTDIATNSFIQNIWDGVPARRLGQDVVMQLQPGLIDDQTSAGLGWVRYAYGQTTRPGGFDARTRGATTHSAWNENTTMAWPAYSWACGSQLAPTVYGSHTEIMASSASIDWKGDESPLSLNITGAGGIKPATDEIEAVADAVDASDENERK